ncbi:MAG: CRISPR-associated helicase Cas3' [Candidatus Micrarchaeia archaeon]|uniref:CRISPR-associated helicase Cas3' n=1 Tax=Saccharolobus sp. TaxID=2100761 RepID=UPI0031696574
MVSLISIYNQFTKKINGEHRPLIEKILLRIQESSKCFMYIVQAPTGYGKTSISITSAIYSIYDASLFPKVIHVLPMRSIVEDVFYRAVEIMEGAVKTKMMDVKEEELEVFHLYPLNVTTVDTFTWDIMKLNTKKIERIRTGREYGYDFLTQGSILDSLIIFDEAHYILEEENLRKIFSIILNFLLKYKTSIIISTATLSNGYKEYFKLLAEQYGYDFDVFTVDSSDPFVHKECKKNFNLQLINNGNNVIEESLKLIDEEKINLIVVNSPYTAVKIYDKLSSSTNMQVFLLHGNMKKKDRKEKLKKIRMLCKQRESCVIVATQVIEAGVDITSDRLITELSVAQSLIQRMGRVARYQEEFADIFVIKSDGRPYPLKKIEKTWTWLNRNKNSFHPRLAETYVSLLDEVHGKTVQEVNPEYSSGHLFRLKSLLIDLRTRSIEVLNEVENILKDTALMRNFTIPVKVDEEYILLTPQEVEKLFYKGLVKVEFNNVELRDIDNFLNIAKEIAIGEKLIEVTYTGKYDCLRGIIP